MATGNRLKVKYIFIIAVMLLIIMEILIRAFITMPSTQLFDPDFGYTNTPGKTLIESMEGYGVNTFNSLGYNDDEPDIKLSRKVFLLGDSYTEALQIDRNKDYAHLLQQMVSKDNVDIIKFARDSYIPYFYPLIYNKYQKKFHSDLTVIQLGSHTISDLYLDYVNVQYNDVGEIVSYKISPNENDKRKESLRLIINNSSLAYYMIRKYKAVFIRQLERIDKITSIFKKSNSNINLINTIKHRNKHDRQDNVKRLKFLLSKIDGPKVVVYIPEPNIFFIKNGSDNLSREVIKETALASNSVFLDLTDEYINHYSHSVVLLNGFSNSKPAFGHLNENGHILVANMLFKTLVNTRYIY